MAIHRKPFNLTVTNYHAVAAARRPGNDGRHFPVCGGENGIPMTTSDVEARMDAAKRTRATVCPNLIPIECKDWHSTAAAPRRDECDERGDDPNEFKESLPR
jgi:hypothetical protein